MADAKTFQIFQPTGILTANTSAELNLTVQLCLEAGIKNMLIDLQSIDFIDSSGLGILVSIHTKVRLAGGKLYFCALKDQARNLFDIADMERIFTIFNTREEFERTIVKKNQAVLVE